MNKFNQAIFGYSNGHRLLASSVILSNPSIKTLEVLSDLSGNDTSSEFNGYYTGCWLPEDDCYAISKTWYASEMPRPGCAWTHTLFLNVGQYSLSIDAQFDEIFKRPDMNIIEWIEFYKNPVLIENSQQLTNRGKDLSSALWLLNVITCEKEAIAISYDNSRTFNHLFEILFSTMGVLFFKDFHFCTGSQSNRLIKEKPLNVQIMPLNISKVVLRTLNTVSAFDYEKCKIKDLNTNDVDFLLKLIKYMLSFGEKYYSYKYFKKFADLYKFLHEENRFEVMKFIEFLQISFDRNETTKLLEISIRTLYENSNADDIAINNIIDIFCCLFTLGSEFDWLTETLNDDIFNALLYELHDRTPKRVVSLIKKSLSSELSSFGEKMIKSLAFIIDSNSFVELIANKEKMGIVLLSLNWKLALNKDLWSHSIGIQYEMLKNISISFKRALENEKCDFIVLLEVIYNFSTQDICEQLYDAFEELAVLTYFSWIVKTDKFHESKWIKLCKYAPKQSIVSLKNMPINNPDIFKVVLNILNPWNNPSLNSIPIDIWESFFMDYCEGKNDNSLNNDYAKFMLQLIISTNIKLSEKFSYFVFMRLHQLLESNELDDLFWNRISPFLPEVKWYNNWDKCKRLRKFAIKSGYSHIFQ